MKEIFTLLVCNWLFTCTYAQWNSVGTGTDLSVYDIEEYAQELWVGGNFKSAGGNSAGNIAKWNGTNWSSPVLIDSAVWVISKIGNDLFIGGGFRNVITSSGTIGANKIVKYDGTTWTAMGTGVDDHDVLAITEYKGDLYIGGTFDRIDGGIPAKGIAKWNGTAFIPVNIPINGYVTSLKVFNNELYIGGDFTMSGTTIVNHIVKWDGINFYAVGNGFDNWVWDLTVHNNELYAGGVFTASGSNRTDYIAKLSSGNWMPLDTLPINIIGPFDGIYTLHSYGNELYAGGIFTTTTGLHDVVRWNVNAWVDAGQGISSSPAVGVMALDSYNGGHYAAGLFTTPAGFVAKWDPPVSSVADETGGLSVDIFPNPTSGVLNITLNKVLEKNMVLDIVDLQGRIVYSSFYDANSLLLNKSKISIDLTSIGISEGFYIARLITENSTNSIKLCYKNE